MKERRLSENASQCVHALGTVEKLFELATMQTLRISKMFGEGQQDGGEERSHPLSPGISRRALRQAKPPGEEARYTWSV